MSIPGACVLVARFPGAGVAAVKALPGEVDSVLAMLQPARVKLDITANETVVRPPVLPDIRHPYPDALPVHGHVRCYSFEELFAAKLRAMAQRGRPRDLYDIVDLFRRNDLRLYPEVILAALVEKCAVKDISAPTALTILND